MISLASHQITCATKIHPHRHITTVGNAQYRWTVTQARAAITAGDALYTVSPSTGARAPRGRRFSGAPAAGLAKGAYVLTDAPDARPEVILIASGSEVTLCLAARDKQRP